MRRPSVSFAASTGPDLAAPEPEEEEEYDRDSVVSSPQVVDKTCTRLVNYVYGQYHESHPLSAPLDPPHCAFEEYFAVSDPPGACVSEASALS